MRTRGGRQARTGVPGRTAGRRAVRKAHFGQVDFYGRDGQGAWCPVAPRATGRSRRQEPHCRLDRRQRVTLTDVDVAVVNLHRQLPEAVIGHARSALHARRIKSPTEGQPLRSALLPATPTPPAPRGRPGSSAGRMISGSVAADRDLAAPGEPLGGVGSWTSARRPCRLR